MLQNTAIIYEQRNQQERDRSTEIEVSAIDKQLPVRLFGDQIRLKQVLVNLVKNALKFSYGKDIILRASYNEQKEFLKISVIDMGKGIERHDLDKLFQYFGKLE